MRDAGRIIDRPGRLSAVHAALLALALAAGQGVVRPRPAFAQGGDSLPFAIGEELRYRVTSARFGRLGRGTMTVEGPVDVRGVCALRLRFDIRGRVGPLAVRSTTESWVARDGFASLRFAKHEKQFLRARDERVEIYPHDRRWREAGEDGAAGDGGETPTDAPLDELSFIYFLRTLPLEDGATYDVARHYQSARNPVLVRVVRRELVPTPAGDFATIVVEMRVRDPRHYKGEGVILLHLSDDRWRTPVRIESEMALAGSTVLVLESRRLAPPAVTHR